MAGNVTMQQKQGKQALPLSSLSILLCLWNKLSKPGFFDDEGQHRVGVVSWVLLQVVNDSGKEMSLVGANAWRPIL